MKRLFFVLILSAVMVTGCDKIEGPYVEVNGTDVTVEFPPLNPDQVYRKILIEEYTGHRCVNCPTGHQKLEELHQIFGDTLVAVGVHFGSLAASSEPEFPTDFRTEVGNQLGADFGIDGIPVAIINRYPEIGGWGPARWQSKIQAVDREKVTAAIQLISQYDVLNKTEKINAKVTMLEDYEGTLRLSFFLVEDGVVSPQEDGNEYIPDYVHNHVLRASFNGTYGSLLNNTGSLPKGESCEVAYPLEFKDKKWNPDHCSVVAILFDKEGGDVLQVETVPVK